MHPTGKGPVLLSTLSWKEGVRPQAHAQMSDQMMEVANFVENKGVCPTL